MPNPTLVVLLFCLKTMSCSWDLTSGRYFIQIFCMIAATLNLFSHVKRKKIVISNRRNEIAIAQWIISINFEYFVSFIMFVFFFCMKHNLYCYTFWNSKLPDLDKLYAPVGIVIFYQVGSNGLLILWRLFWLNMYRSLSFTGVVT